MPSTRDAVTVTAAVLRDWPLPAPGGDKEQRGRIVIAAGSDQTPGAVLLAAEAAIRAGAGKLQVATAASVARHVAIALPEALVVPLPEDGGDISPDAAEQIAGLAEHASALLLGPGARDAGLCRALVLAVLPRLRCPVILDAAALAAAGADPGALHHLAGRAVLTPNRKELALATGNSLADAEARTAELTLGLAEAAQATVTCGGREAWTAAPDGRLWCDQTGGAGLAVSGSGDVFAGIVAGLVARGASPEQAAVWGNQLHGRAGDRLAAAVGRLGYLAREIPAEVPRVLAEIEV
jgi:hydroxyethylthiazole kinase-like uncharacterized protein yjeF